MVEKYKNTIDFYLSAGPSKRRRLESSPTHVLLYYIVPFYIRNTLLKYFLVYSWGCASRIHTNDQRK